MKSAIFRAHALPLLLVELKQMAASKRTYIIRFAYAATLFSVACWLFFYESSAGVEVTEISTSQLDPTAAVPAMSMNRSQPKLVLGSGGSLFKSLVLMQFFALCVVIPASTCGVIAEDRRNETLSVLMLSPVGGFAIIAQKLLSRLVPMFSFVLLSLPLLAVAYSYGGVSNSRLVMGVILLLMTCVQIGSLSILMSVLCRTTVTALLGTYLTFVLTVFGCTFCWPALYQDALDTWGVLIWFVFCGGCYFAASLCLTNRVFQTSHNYLLQLQRQLDRFAQDANRLVDGIELMRPRSNGPRFNPVRWRETDRRSLGRLRYLVRLLVLVELPLIAIAWMVSRQVGLAHTVLRGILWLGSLILVGVYASGLIAGERSNRTLDVLLTTPIEGRTILLEKASGLWRLFVVIGVPAATIALIEYLKLPPRNDHAGVFDIDLLWSILCAAVWLPAIGWFALWVSTRVRTATRATLIVLIAIGAVLVVPTVFASIVRTAGAPDTVLGIIGVFSPTQIQATLSPYAFDWFALPRLPVWVYAIHFGILIGITFLCRFLALRDIDTVLGRIPEGYTVDESKAPKEALQPAES